MGDVTARTCVEIIYAQNFLTTLDQPFAEMRANEACPARDEDAPVHSNHRFDAPGFWPELWRASS
jgi:hypothetical protein